MRKMTLTAMAVGLAFVGLTMASCSEEPLEPQTSAYRADAQPAGDDSEMEIVQSVTGNGHNNEGEIRRITRTINIFKYEDGTVEGWYHARGRGTTSSAHVRVRIDCLHVAGNQAWASGTVVAAVNPDNIGRPYAVRVVDNGEGSRSAPDEVGSARFIDYDCTTEPDIPLRQLSDGNIKVTG
jgi:hypothetical protein